MSHTYHLHPDWHVICDGDMRGELLFVETDQIGEKVREFRMPSKVVMAFAAEAVRHNRQVALESASVEEILGVERL